MVKCARVKRLLCLGHRQWLCSKSSVETEMKINVETIIERPNQRPLDVLRFPARFRIRITQRL